MDFEVENPCNPCSPSLCVKPCLNYNHQPKELVPQYTGCQSYITSLLSHKWFDKLYKEEEDWAWRGGGGGGGKRERQVNIYSDLGDNKQYTG